MQNNEIRLRSVSKHYHSATVTTTVFDNLDLTFDTGAMTAVLGPSGSGKSTLLNLISAIDTPDKGSVMVDEVIVSGLDNHQATLWRRSRLGYMFQDAGLIEALNAQENIQLPMLLQKGSKTKRLQRSAVLLDIVGLPELAQRYPAELSRGQQQRIALARALAATPQILLCDEPTGNLDRASAEAVMRLLGELRSHFNLTIILATHDLAAAEHADVIVTLSDCSRPKGASV